jgi:hypothetical protein
LLPRSILSLQLLLRVIQARFVKVHGLFIVLFVRLESMK